jgi:hypothetical protein
MAVDVRSTIFLVARIFTFLPILLPPGRNLTLMTGSKRNGRLSTTKCDL